MNDYHMRRAGEDLGQQLVDTFRNIRAHTVTVRSVDDTFAYVTAFEGDAETPIPLRFMRIGDTSIVAKPTVGSLATIMFPDGNTNTPVFLAFSSLDALALKVGESAVNVTPNQITFNGGENAGMVLINQLTNKLNALVSDFNAFTRTFNTHTHVAAGVATSQPPVFAGPTVSFNQADYENKKITQ